MFNENAYLNAIVQIDALDTERYRKLWTSAELATIGASRKARACSLLMNPKRKVVDNVSLTNSEIQMLRSLLKIVLNNAYELVQENKVSEEPATFLERKAFMKHVGKVSNIQSKLRRQLARRGGGI